MGNSVSWVTQNFCPEEQVLWVAAKSGDLATIEAALARLSPETRAYLEWKDPAQRRTPLANACAGGHTRCALALLGAGADVNARDAKGFTPLHLAIAKARSDVVRVLLEQPQTDVHARTQLKRQTPLDLARYEYNHEYEGSSERIVQCIELVEKKVCVYSGWLHQRVDNLLSLASGISSLNSWKKRYCMVLRTADPNVVEIDLFAMKPGEKRPACPTLELVYKLSDGFLESSDPMWFNRKEHRFSLSAYTKDGINRVSAPQTFDFAAASHGDLVSWKTFFGGMSMRASTFLGRTSISATPAAAAPAPPVLTSMLDEQRDLERALHLSLEEARRQSATAAVVAAAASTQVAVRRTQASPPPQAAASAPPWSDAFTAYSEPMLAPDGVEIVQPLQPLPSVVSSDAASHNTAASAASSAAAAAAESSASNECVICFDGPKATVCVPCGHNAICMDCADHLLRSSKQCPVCRVTVREVVRIYHV